MKKIAILGATGYIGRSVINQFLSEKNNYKYFLFSRSPEKLTKTLATFPNIDRTQVFELSLFNDFDYDVIINCTGIGDPAVLKKEPLNIFRVTEEIDNLILAYLSKKPKTTYINLSSGAVYGNNIHEPVTNKTQSLVNCINSTPYELYSIAKINSEAKHRSYAKLNIIDVRVFAFFSSLVDPQSGFLMSEIVSALKSKKVFKTTNEDIIRDFITPVDLVRLLNLCIKKNKINDSFDVYSKKPLSKFELLSALEKKYGLKHTLEKKSSPGKKAYYSKNKKAKEIGYLPLFSSLEGILFELSKMKLN